MQGKTSKVRSNSVPFIDLLFFIIPGKTFLGIFHPLHSRVSVAEDCFVIPLFEFKMMNGLFLSKLNFGCLVAFPHDEKQKLKKTAVTKRYFISLRVSN